MAGVTIAGVIYLRKCLGVPKREILTDLVADYVGLATSGDVEVRVLGQVVKSVEVKREITANLVGNILGAEFGRMFLEETGKKMV